MPEEPSIRVKVTLRAGMGGSVLGGAAVRGKLGCPGRQCKLADIHREAKERFPTLRTPLRSSMGEGPVHARGCTMQHAHLA